MAPRPTLPESRSRIEGQQPRSDRFTEVEDRYAGYTVYDRAGEKIGKVDDLFLDEDDNPEYIGVKMGFLGTRSTLIPFQAASVDDERQSLFTRDGSQESEVE